MAEKVAVTKSKIVAVGDAIREKAGTTDEYGLDEMPQAIRGIQGGGGSEEYDCFISGVNMPTEFNNDGEKIKDYLYHSATSCIPVYSINLPKVKDIGQYAFYSHTSFSENGTTRLNIPKVENIGTYAFRNRFTNKSAEDSIINLNLQNLQTIGIYAFYGCSAIKTVSFPNLKTVTSYSFDSCTGLSGVNMPTVKTIQGYAFNRCGALISAEFPSVTSVQGYAFSNCTALTKLKFPAVKTLSSSAFMNIGGAETGVTIDLDGELSSIPSQAFLGASSQTNKISAVILRKNTLISLTNSNVFNYSWIKTETDKGFVYVPDNLVNSYKAATNWSTIADKIKPLSEYMEVE